MADRAERHRASMKDRAKDVQGRVETAYGQAKDARKTSAAVDLLFRAGEHDREAGGSILAAALAFRFFLLSLPFVLVIVLVLGIFAGGPEAASKLFQEGGVGGLVASSVAAAQQSGFLSWIITLVTGLVVAAWAGMGLAKALNQSSRFAWGLPYRPLEQAVVTTGIVLAVLLGLTILTPTLGFMHERTGPLLDLAVAAIGWLLAAIGWLIILARLQRPREVPWTALIPGALAFGLVMQILRVGTAVWIGLRASAASDTYGDLGNAVALLAWLAILGRLAVGSSVINVALWERQHPRQRGDTAEPPAA